MWPASGLSFHWVDDGVHSGPLSGRFAAALLRVDALMWKPDPQTQSSPTVVACQFLIAVIRPEGSVLAQDLVQFCGGAWRYGGSRACRAPDEAALDQVDVFGGKRQGVLPHPVTSFASQCAFIMPVAVCREIPWRRDPPRAAGRPGSGRGRRTEARPEPFQRRRSRARERMKKG